LAATSNLSFAFVTMLIQMVTFGLLARLLTPADYGIFALANAILVYVMHLSQRGLSSSLLCKQALSAADMGAAYFMCVVMAAGMGAIVLAIVGIIVVASGGTLLLQAQMLAFMAIPLAIQILITPASAQLQRRLAMVSVNLIQITSIVVGNGIVAIACARAGLGPWSLALGGAAGAATTALPTLWLGRAPVQFDPSWNRLWQVMKEGLQFNGLRSLDIAWLQAPTIILGATAAPAAVGIYQRVQFLADLAMQMTVWRISSVIYAALASRHQGREPAKDRYRIVLTILSCLVFPIVAFVLVSGREVIAVLLGAKWMSGVFTFKLLIVAFGLSTLNHAAGMALEHAGRLRQRAVPALTALALVVALLLIVMHGPAQGFALPALTSMACATIVLHLLVGERLRDFPALARAISPGLLLAVATASGAWLGRLALSLVSPSASDPLRLLAEVAGGTSLDLLAVPLLCALPAVRPLLLASRSAFPALFSAMRFVHRIPAKA
jgi:O-antigen/teichoic acid export membrane protein